MHAQKTLLIYTELLSLGYCIEDRINDNRNTSIYLANKFFRYPFCCKYWKQTRKSLICLIRSNNNC